MKHAILGAGGVGLALASRLVESGYSTVLIMRAASLAEYDGTVRVHSALRGSTAIPINAIEKLSEAVDVLWITVKSPDLTAALTLVDHGVHPGLAIPLLNGLSHLDPLRRRFGSAVLPAAVRVEAERTAPGRLSWPSGHAEIELGAGEHDPDRVRSLAAALRRADIGCSIDPDPNRVLWRKLVLLVPLALATTAADGPLGVVRRDVQLRELLTESVRELCGLASAKGVALDAEATLAAVAALPGRTDTSLHRDVAGGRASELADLTDPLLADGHLSGLSAVTQLVKRAGATGCDRLPPLRNRRTP